MEPPLNNPINSWRGKSCVITTSWENLNGDETTRGEMLNSINLRQKNVETQTNRKCSKERILAHRNWECPCFKGLQEAIKNGSKTEPETFLWGFHGSCHKPYGSNHRNWEWWTMEPKYYAFRFGDWTPQSSSENMTGFLGKRKDPTKRQQLNKLDDCNSMTMTSKFRNEKNTKIHKSNMDTDTKQ